MALAAIWTMEVAAETAAHAALECRGVVLPAPVVYREPRHEANRYGSGSPHSHYAHV
jgi:hypothetical protein